MKKLKNQTLMSLKIVLIIGFSIFLNGCSTFYGTSNIEHVKWNIPEAPKTKPVAFISVKNQSVLNLKEDIIYTNLEGAKNLTYNLDATDAYIKKLLVLINEMQKYYEGK